MSLLKEPNTRVWRRERGITQKSESALFYSPSSVVFAKLKGVLHLHQLCCSESLPNAILVGADPAVLGLAVRQWRESLSSVEYAEVQGALFESRTPSATDLTRAFLRLESLDRVLARIHTRWFVKLLAADSLSVVFQPLVSLPSGSTVACECLVRGNRDSHPVGAESLLSAARVLDMSHELDHAAWRAALRQGHDLMQTGLALFLNFTPSSMYSSAFTVKNLKGMCLEMGVDISRLVVEVTEAEKVNDFDSLKSVMQEYRAEGVKIALDDLGSGYSSILRLADLQPDYVKLDQRLVHGAYGDNVRRVLLEAVTEAAHKLDIRVVAEGVETEDDLKLCLEIGADLGQGYFLAPPEEIPLPISAEALRVLEQSFIEDILELQGR